MTLRLEGCEPPFGRRSPSMGEAPVASTGSASATAPATRPKRAMMFVKCMVAVMFESVIDDCCLQGI